MEQWYLLLRSNFYELDSSSQEIIYYKFREFIYQDILLLLIHNVAKLTDLPVHRLTHIMTVSQKRKRMPPIA